MPNQSENAELLPELEPDDPTTDAEKGHAIMDEINLVNAADPARFMERSFALIWNEGHSVRLINRENPRWAISIPWEDIDALVNLLRGTRPVVAPVEECICHKEGNYLCTICDFYHHSGCAIHANYHPLHLFPAQGDSVPAEEK